MSRFRDLAFYNEIQSAMSERMLAALSQPLSPLTENNYCQSVYLYSNWQTYLETFCLNYIDHINGPLAADKKDFLKFTLATWRTAAGLNPAGFTRYNTNGSVKGYGIAQLNDAICPPLLSEIQRGISALKWSIGGGYNYNTTAANAWPSSDSMEWRAAYYADTAPWTTLKAEAESLYNAGEQYEYGYIIGGMTNGNNYSAIIGAGFAIDAYIPLATVFPMTAIADGYIYPEKITYNSAWASPLSEYYANGDGYTENEFTQISTGTYAANSNKAPIGSYGHSIASKPAWCNTPTSDARQQKGWLARTTFSLFKWNFTNA